MTKHDRTSPPAGPPRPPGRAVQTVAWFVRHRRVTLVLLVLALVGAGAGVVAGARAINARGSVTHHECRVTGKHRDRERRGSGKHRSSRTVDRVDTSCGTFEVARPVTGEALWAELSVGGVYDLVTEGRGSGTEVVRVSPVQ